MSLCLLFEQDNLLEHQAQLQQENQNLKARLQALKEKREKEEARYQQLHSENEQLGREVYNFNTTQADIRDETHKLKNIVNEQQQKLVSTLCVLSLSLFSFSLSLSLLFLSLSSLSLSLSL